MKRIEALHEATKITKEHCEGCEYNFTNIKKCEGCPHFNNLRNIGNALIAETAEKRKNKPKPEAKKVKRKTKRQGRPVSRPCTLTVGEYRKLKRKGLNDYQVADANDCSYKALGKFKRENNLMKAQ